MKNLFVILILTMVANATVLTANVGSIQETAEANAQQAITNNDPELVMKWLMVIEQCQRTRTLETAAVLSDEVGGQIDAFSAVFRTELNNLAEFVKAKMMKELFDKLRPVELELVMSAGNNLLQISQQVEKWSEKDTVSTYSIVPDENPEHVVEFDSMNYVWADLEVLAQTATVITLKGTNRDHRHIQVYNKAQLEVVQDGTAFTLLN